MTELPILSDQLVRIDIGGTRQMIGICSGHVRKRDGNNISIDYQLKGLNNLMAKNYIDSNFAEGSNTSDLIEALCDDGRGITAGEITTSGVLDQAIQGSHQESCEILNTVATTEGKQWWVDDDLNLNFTSRYYDHIGDYPDWAPFHITDIDGLLDEDMYSAKLEDFYNFSVVEDTEDYANFAVLIGAERNGVTMKSMAVSAQDHDDYICVTGYMAAAVYVHSDTNITEYIDINISDTGTTTYQVIDTIGTPGTPEIYDGDSYFNATLNKMSFITTISTLSTVTANFSISPSIAGQTANQKIWYMPRLNEAAKSILASRSGYAPLAVSFDLDEPGILPRQMMLIFESKLNIVGFFMIQSVRIEDQGAGIFNFSVVAEKRPQILASLISQKDFSMYFNDL
jgi:hypothetical protein